MHYRSLLSNHGEVINYWCVQRLENSFFDSFLCFSVTHVRTSETTYLHWWHRDDWILLVDPQDRTRGRYKGIFHTWRRGHNDNLERNEYLTISCIIGWHSHKSLFCWNGFILKIFWHNSKDPLTWSRRLSTCEENNIKKCRNPGSNQRP